MRKLIVVAGLLASMFVPIQPASACSGDPCDSMCDFIENLPTVRVLKYTIEFTDCGLR